MLLLKKNIPNLISISRVLLAYLFVVSISHKYTIFSILCITLGAISDFFDGYIARKLGLESKVGQILDPLADKIFSNAVLWGIYIFYKHPFPILLVAIPLTIRDLFLVFGSVFSILKKWKLDIAPIYLSKICTTLVFILCFFVLIFDPISTPIKILSFVTFGCIIVTAYMYYKRFLFFKNDY